MMMRGLICGVSYMNGGLKPLGPKKWVNFPTEKSKSDRRRKGGELIKRLSGHHFISSPFSVLIIIALSSYCSCTIIPLRLHLGLS